MQGDYW